VNEINYHPDNLLASPLVDYFLILLVNLSTAQQSVSYPFCSLFRHAYGNRGNLQTFKRSVYGLALIYLN